MVKELLFHRPMDNLQVAHGTVVRLVLQQVLLVRQVLILVLLLVDLDMVDKQAAVAAVDQDLEAVVEVETPIR